MSEAPSSCRLCGGVEVRTLGTIPDSDYFAGRVLTDPIRGGSLWSCDSCQSMFRHPTLADSEYLRLYQQGKETQWAGGEHRRDCPLICSVLTADRNIGSVLDVGCATGEFLASLPPHIKRFGVEPSAAARSAAARGISIVASTLDALSADAKFDAVTMIDVIEHLVDPGAFLSAAYAHVTSGGVLVVSTGAPENLLWRRVFRSRFWYCGFPEHISFPSLRFFHRWCERTPGARVSRQIIRYQRISPASAIVGLCIQAVYWMSPRGLNLLGRLFLRNRRSAGPRRRYFTPGIPGLFRDHQVVTITRRLSE